MTVVPVCVDHVDAATKMFPASVGVVKRNERRRKVKCLIAK
jgi:hypothetical protein